MKTKSLKCIHEECAFFAYNFALFELHNRLRLLSRFPTARPSQLCYGGASQIKQSRTVLFHVITFIETNIFYRLVLVVSVFIPLYFYFPLLYFLLQSFAHLAICRVRVCKLRSEFSSIQKYKFKSVSIHNVLLCLIFICLPILLLLLLFHTVSAVFIALFSTGWLAGFG